jgi:hypothetical protein
VLRLTEYLSGNGLRVWSDPQIGAGELFAEIIEREINACAAVIVVMSRSAAASKWVASEVEWADRRNKPVVPLLLGGDVFFHFANTQYVDVRRGELPPPGFVAELRRLCGLDPTAPVVGSPAVGSPAPGWSTVVPSTVGPPPVGSPSGFPPAVGSPSGFPPAVGSPAIVTPMPASPPPVPTARRSTRATWLVVTAVLAASCLCGAFVAYSALPTVRSFVNGALLNASPSTIPARTNGQSEATVTTTPPPLQTSRPVPPTTAPPNLIPVQRLPRPLTVSQSGVTYTLTAITIDPRGPTTFSLRIVNDTDQQVTIWNCCTVVENPTGIQHSTGGFANYNFTLPVYPDHILPRTTVTGAVTFRDWTFASATTSVTLAMTMNYNNSLTDFPTVRWSNIALLPA